MVKVSAAKKQREKKKTDKLFAKQAKAEKMRSVLASLALAAQPKLHLQQK